MDFLSEDNACGQSLLHLVARGSAIVAELLRMSEYVPAAFLNDPPPEARQYQRIIADFSKLKSVRAFEEEIQNNPELLELDDAFRETNLEILERYYILFESMHKYYTDYTLFLQLLKEQSYINYSMENIMLEAEGKKLMCEALYYLGVMMLLLDIKIPGLVRERILMSYYRYKGHATIQDIHEVCEQCRDSGFLSAFEGTKGRRPPNYPEQFLSRVSVPLDVVELVLCQLKEDDVYQQVAAYPSSEHKSSALANQGAMLYVVLFFNVEYLINEGNKMREIVDKFFLDNWVVPFYLGFIVDLTEQWAPYKAAKSCLATYTMNISSLQTLQQKRLQKMQKVNEQLNQLLTEGILTDEYILLHLSKLLHVMRDGNVVLRWFLLHRLSHEKKVLDIITVGLDERDLLSLLMNLAQYEVTIRQRVEELLKSKETAWEQDRTSATERMRELADYFSGTRPLAKEIQREESYMKWFQGMETHITSLNLSDAGQAVRKLQQLVQALEDVTKYHKIENNIAIKEFIELSKNDLKHMLSLAKLQPELMQHIAVIKDFSYAWLCMDEFLGLMQKMIREEPRNVLLLKATILKLSSILDVPLVRIVQSSSPDMESVSDYFSKELVRIVRTVLQVIPQAVFTLLDEITTVLSTNIRELPSRIKKEEVKEYAALEERKTLANHTQQISVFTQGVMAMEKTLLGMIEVDPKQLLEDGVRRELTIKLGKVLNDTLIFRKETLEEFTSKLVELGNQLTNLRRSFEYVQDFIGIYGLKLWQEEMTRIIGYNVDLESSAFFPLKRSLEETYSTATFPIQKFQQQDATSLTCMGRLVRCLINFFDVKKTVYIEWMHGWYDFTGVEIVGLEMMTKLHQSLGIVGLTRTDRLVACFVTQRLRFLVRKYKEEIKFTSFDDVIAELQPVSRIPERGRELYNSTAPAMASFGRAIQAALISLGQLQLLRRLIAYQLNFRARVDSPALWSSLQMVNLAVMNDIKHATAQPFPPEEDTLLPELEDYMMQCGFHNPLEKIYLKPGPALTKFPLVMALYTINQISNLRFEKKLGGLVRRTKNEAVDGAPLIVGILTFFRQFHSELFLSYMAYLGQFVKTGIIARDKKQKDASADLTTMLVFIEELRRYAGLGRDAIEKYLPAYVFDNFAS